MYFYVQKDKNIDINYVEADSKVNNSEVDNNEVNNEEKNLEEKLIGNNEIKIHIAGAVVNPGIIELNQGDRISDAIDQAGGLLIEANLTNINLAEVIEDGMKIYIATNEEMEYLQEESINILPKTGEVEIKDEKININTATESELDTLPGIGEVTAMKIIEHREKNGEFYEIEDLKNVSGIGESKFEEIKDKIKV